MPAVEMPALQSECAVLTRYLCGVLAGDYVSKKYAEAHTNSPNFEPYGRFDRLLLRWGTRNTLCARFVDSYACLFARRSALRRKLILLLAILESCPNDPAGLDRAGGNFWGITFFVVLRGALFALTMLVAAVALLPVQIALGGLGAPREKAGHA